MTTIHFDAAACNLCRQCIEKCPFGALTLGDEGLEVNEKCRMCGVCVKVCPVRAIRFEQKPSRDPADKSKWKGILIFAEQENGELHPVTYELIGEARRLAAKVGYAVFAVLVGGEETEKNAEELLPYGVKEVFYYQHPGFSGFRADCCADAVADCISQLRPSVVLIGATALGRSLAPRLSVRFHTGLTADCTKLDINPNTDLVQIRPAFGGNVMARILMEYSRPQFATVRYRVMDRAEKTDGPTGRVKRMPVSDAMARSGIEVLKISPLPREKTLEEEEILVVAGRGAKNEEGVALVRSLAEALGGRLCFTRPMAECGLGDGGSQIGLSGRTVRPKLIITCGVSGAIQFTAGMSGSECIVAINSDPNAQIFSIAHYCVVDDLFQAVPAILEQLETGKEAL
ncbi:electron transfer flavoprotein subunit alpha [Papillibacter cinnamivorans]|uniref:Electron transfer flavoprotein alpha subunit apoprotein n=1 Tax=Papillibacter cinnamivorans DSM 12816 TaxID=1122930 RepID=A0A1W2C0J0_9FIRM|nr:electron transfer flavoprotein subunit alpha [Papillibacter cinnamivorans]SMC78703.1 electron transfer flavoprotein alpha subunit apoprotein [Papillibacter cinnamivorans DSM 12816]